MQYLGEISKTKECSQFICKTNHHYHSNLNLCPIIDAKEAEVEQSYKDLQDLLELTPKKMSLSSQGTGCRSRNSRDPWSNRQVWTRNTKWSREKAKSFCQKNTVIAKTLYQEHERQLYTWTSPDVQDLNQFDYILCSQKWRSSIQSEKKENKLGADCGSYHELLIAKFRLEKK